MLVRGPSAVTVDTRPPPRVIGKRKPAQRSRCLLLQMICCVCYARARVCVRASNLHPWLHAGERAYVHTHRGRWHGIDTR